LITILITNTEIYHQNKLGYYYYGSMCNFGCFRLFDITEYLGGEHDFLLRGDTFLLIAWNTFVF